jgi:eukaryotic-like serine/threonine-protein kinase
MTLAPGSRLGVYEVSALIGTGGMGEVYRARDTKLGRDVAIKVLPVVLSSDPERVARFEREARLLAALNHPHIATIHGVEVLPAPGLGQALVLELLEGPTLADRLAAGALPPAEALTIARQIAEALDAAHQKGIIHRDLKPANIKLTPGRGVKVLDFGIGKLANDDVNLELTQSPTVTRGTGEGVILGTARYMSPEQARGQPLDKRTDIWSFGCVLYELLTGRTAFQGETLSDTIAAVLSREPDWTSLPAATPASIRALLRRCLEKDPMRRLRDIGDAQFELEAESATPREGQPVRRTSARNLAFVSLIAIVVAVALAAALWLRPRTDAPAEPVRLTATLGAGVSVIRGPGYASSVALSPDGRTLIVAGSSKDGQALYQRTLDRLEATPLAGTSGGSSPFFSPDGAWVGFLADGRLRRVPAGGGAAVDIAAVPGVPGGASWGADDRIVFVSGARSPMQVVDARGGDPVPLTTLDVEAGEISHAYPEISTGRPCPAVHRGSARRLAGSRPSISRVAAGPGSPAARTRAISPAGISF